MKNSFIHFYFGVVLSLFAFSLDLHGQVVFNPTAVWKRIRTEHFEIIHNASQQALADRIALDAELSYKKLQPIFQETPERTVIVVADQTDQANGLATPIPRPMVVAFPVFPSLLDSIGFYSDWTHELILHEYVHILNFEPSHGAMKPLRFIFGAYVRPNALLPRWYLEGLAVELETRLSEGGRLRSPMTSAMIRAQIESSSWGQEKLDRINETSIPLWPRGQRPYFYGSLLWNEMIQQKGLDTVYDLNQRYSARVPFFLEEPIEDRFQKRWIDLLDDMYSHTTKTANDQLAQIKKNPTSQGPSLWEDSETSGMHSPRFSPDGLKLAFIAETFHRDSEIRYVTRTDRQMPFSQVTEKKVLTSGKNIQKISWHPDSQSLIFDKVDTDARYDIRSDLYQVTLDKKIKRLTKGLRAREAAVSPDGKSLVFIQLGGGTSALLQLALEEGKDFANNLPKVLVEAPMGIRLSRPEFLNPSTVIYSRQVPTFGEKLETYNFLKAQATTAWDLPASTHSPVPTSKGLLVSSLSGGVQNLYLLKDNSTAKAPVPLTNVTTFAQSGDLDPVRGDLIVSRLTHQGFRLEFTESKKLEGIVPAVSQSQPLVGEFTFPKQSFPERGSLLLDHDDYSASPYLLPTYWIPFYSPLPGGSLFQASVYGSDPLLRHSYILDFSYDTLSDKVSEGVLYTNRTTPVGITLLAINQYQYLFGLQTTVRNKQASVIGDSFIAGLSNKWRLLFGWNFLETEHPAFDYAKRQGPSLGFVYQDFEKRGFQISPESGGSAQLVYSKYLPSPLSSVTYDQLAFDGTFYFSSILPEHNVLYLETNTIYSPAERSILLGTTSAGGQYSASLLSSKYVARGYPLGEFVGYSLMANTVEYRFPLSYRFSGFDSDNTPFFLRSMHGAFFVDAVTLDGAFVESPTNVLRRVRWGRTFVSAGGEWRFDTTVVYHMPLQFVLGVYKGFESDAYGNWTLYLGLATKSF